MKKIPCFAPTQPQGEDLKTKGKWLISLLCALLITVSASAQSKTITGRITNEKNQPLEGASIRLKIANAGTVTNADGTYSFPVPNGTDALVFSMVVMPNRK